ncbi:MAG TPA: hypothetical protein VGP56_08725 [Gaiellaceae bacterium]|jgi:hypothetical protein|nr:hypothetical protein [Gaiellaceae bacterium]
MSSLRRLVCLAVGVLLLAGCGASGTKAMEVKFERLDFKMTAYETANSAYNQQHLAEATQRYIALVHQYADVLGPEEARKRLNQKADELSSFCLPCSGVLSEEAKKF